MNAENGGHAQGGMISGFSSVFGSGSNDTLTGGNGGQTFWGGRGNDKSAHRRALA
jgi:Ca2+-binding RTX toxin-like protein